MFGTLGQFQYNEIWARLLESHNVSNERFEYMQPVVR